MFYLDMIICSSDVTKWGRLVRPFSNRKFGIKEKTWYNKCRKKEKRIINDGGKMLEYEMIGIAIMSFIVWIGVVITMSQKGSNHDK